MRVKPRPLQKKRLRASVKPRNFTKPCHGATQDTHKTRTIGLSELALRPTETIEGILS